MADAPYLIALALLVQDGQRAMPLQGKSLREPIAPDGDPGDVGRGQALELLVRIWQRSDDGSIQRAAGEHSLLLAEVPLEALQSQIPNLKANWLNGGSADALVQELARVGGRIWRVSQEPRSALVFERIS